MTAVKILLSAVEILLTDIKILLTDVQTARIFNYKKENLKTFNSTCSCVKRSNTELKTNTSGVIHTYFRGTMETQFRGYIVFDPEKGDASRRRRPEMLLI